MSVPATVEYMGQFSAKKRYNIKRQLRQLASAGGELNVRRVESVEQVGTLVNAFVSLGLPAEMSTTKRRAFLEAQARHGLLLSFVIVAGERTVGIVVGSRSADVFHVHNIHIDESLRSLSVGTSTMHLALVDIITMGGFRLIDFGYGDPKHNFHSSHLIQTRAAVAMVRTGTPTHRLLQVRQVFCLMTQSLLKKIKRLRNA